MSLANIRSKGNVVDKEDEIGQLSVTRGSLLEYIPSYNNLFN